MRRHLKVFHFKSDQNAKGRRIYFGENIQHPLIREKSRRNPMSPCPPPGLFVRWLDKSENAFYIGLFIDHFFIEINEVPDKIRGTGHCTGVAIRQNLFCYKKHRLLSITFSVFSFIRPLTLKSEVIVFKTQRQFCVGGSRHQFYILHSHGSVSLDRRRIYLIMRTFEE